MLELMKSQNNELSNEQLNWIIANYGERMSELGDFNPANDSGWTRRKGIKPFYTEVGREFAEVLCLERCVQWKAYQKESLPELRLEPLGDFSKDRKPSFRAGVRPFLNAWTPGRWFGKLRAR